jgi:hypothetical protein
MYISTSAPADVVEGALWFNSNTAQTFIYYDSHWVEVGNAAANNGSSFFATIGNNVDTSYVLEHNFNTRDVLVNTRNSSSPYEDIDIRWEATTENTVTVYFSAPPGNSSVRAAVYSSANAGTSVSTNLAGLQDTVFASLNAGDYLKFDGTNWVNDTISDSFLDINNPQTHEILKYNGTKFTNSPEGIFNDNILLINNGSAATPSLNAGLEIERGDFNNVLLRWNETSDVWEFTNDGSSYQQLGKTSVTVSSTAPSTPYEGQIWFDSSEGGTYVYYGSSWIEVGAAPMESLLATIDAKGDLLVGTGDNAVSRLIVGTNGQMLVANSATQTGLEWTSVSYSPINSPTFTGSVTLPSTTSIGNVSNTEISYLDGVTSSIQTQIDTKASTGKAIAMAIVFSG